MRLKQEDYDKVPKIIENDKKEENQNDNLDSSKYIRERCVRAIEFLFTPEDCFC
jgi:hypothetical protein